MPLLEVKSMHRFFGSGNTRVHVLKNINLSVKSGEFIAIMGQSGSGKSTLMNILGCLDNPTSGSYSIAGRQTSKMSANELATLRSKKFGFIFQKYNLLTSLSALENVALPAIYSRYDKAKRTKHAYQLLQDLGLSGKEKNNPNQLSGGQQQRVSIARALMNGGEVIFADEPTGALDSESGEMVMKILQNLHKQGHTIILVTHDTNIANFAHRVIEMKDGEVISDKTKKQQSKKKGISSKNKRIEKSSWLLWQNQFWESFVMSWQAILSHKLRSLLTMLGIIIGIASVISIVALGKGTQKRILQEISSMGSNTISIYPGYGFGDMRSRRIRTLSVADAHSLDQQSYVENVTPMMSSSGIITFHNQSLTAFLYGVGEQYFQVQGIKVAQGRPLLEDDISQSRQVVVIDYNTKLKLFSNANALGEIILFNKRPLKVVGVVEKNKNQMQREGGNLTLWSPYTSVMQRISGAKHIRSIVVKIKTGFSIEAAEKNLTKLLALRHGTKDFFTETSDSIRKTIESTTNSMTILISSIAVISLVVGGIGVMNIMLVSVTERTKEIGIRMAVGANQFDILQQFLLEAILICLMGGVMGIAFSYLISLLFYFLVNDFSMSFSFLSIVVAVFSSTIIGIIFGFMPAKNASQLNPVEALSRD